MLSRARNLTLATALATVAAVGGCYAPGGNLFSASDSAVTYYSTETEQKTVTLLDMRTDEPFFVQVIPPGFQLTMQFYEGGGEDPVLTPDRMMYGILKLGTQGGKLPNQLTVPPSFARRIDISVTQDVDYRPTPPEQRLRTDQLEDRPAYWTPQGGARPDNDRLYDD